MVGEVFASNRDDFGVDKLVKHHDKYVVHSAAFTEDLLNSHQRYWLATAGWDKKVNVYAHISNEQLLEHRVATLSFPTNPESILFTVHPDTGHLMLVVSRQDSTHLYFYWVAGPTSGHEGYVCKETGKQNLAPHSNAWVAFTPSCLALCPTDKTLVAVATNQTPHLKLIIVRLLFPDSTAEMMPNAQITQASQARQALAIQDREDAAIQIQVSTMAPQTPYSTPQVCWRPDGSGVWVNGDDGVVRGVEAISGKIVVTMKDGHEAGSKIRTMCAGNVIMEDGKEMEILVTGGFDKRLVVWMVPDGEGGT
ncbi:MAG: hypothetical protein Q9227_007304 [Pyrenula ochraceoflavens]